MPWISKNKFLSTSEQQNNALMFWAYFSAHGWTLNAVAGMLGNIQHESTINPGIWEGLNSDQSVHNKGYGLVQWTPWTKYADWAGADWENNGNLECERIIWERDNGAQYYSTSAYPLSFTAFSQSTQSAAYLARAFLHNYERPAEFHDTQRGDSATKWYSYLAGQPTPPPAPDPTPTYQQQVLYRRRNHGIRRTIYLP
jgi:hypothetical protein